MNVQLFALIPILLIAVSCSNTHKNSSSLVHQIESLNTVEKQKQYLIEIYRLDQLVRKNETAQSGKFGYQSQEHKLAIEEVMTTDELNLNKVELYLEKFGHPNMDQHGKEACNVPWLIIHHAMDGLAPRRRNFKYIYVAYKNGDINDNAISFYLNRMYDIQYGNRIEWDRPYRIEEELDTLFKALDLIDLVNEVNDK